MYNVYCITYVLYIGIAMFAIQLALGIRLYNVYLMIILLEKVAPVPLFTDNFQRIFTIRRYHPRCENLT